MENSSPLLRPKLTSLSARTPPNRRETPRTSNTWFKYSLPLRCSLRRGIFGQPSKTKSDSVRDDAIKGRAARDICVTRHTGHN